MAREAERLLADTGWLPEPLRLVLAAEGPAAVAQTGGHDGAALPDFLASNDEADIADAKDEEPHLVTAE
jgi:ParB family chromosome partitioning protein